MASSFSSRSMPSKHGNPVPTWMASNCVVDRREWFDPAKERAQDSQKKIDGTDVLSWRSAERRLAIAGLHMTATSDRRPVAVYFNTFISSTASIKASTRILSDRKPSANANISSEL